jgi:sugar phosphate isomerase/epimerase
MQSFVHPSTSTPSSSPSRSFDRRHALRSLAVAAGSIAWLRGSTMSNLFAQEAPGKAAMRGYIDQIGLQLWTVRNQIAADRDATLKAIKQAGYYQVETSNPLKDKELIKAARDHGLKVHSSFIDWTTIGKDPAADVPKIEAVVEAAKELALEHLVFGYIGKGSRETADQYKAIIERSNKAASMCKEAGIQLCYHNHSFEFEPIDGGKCGFELLIDGFEADTMKFELDIFWAAIGGYDPLETLKRLKGRVSQLHLKDLKEGTEKCWDEGKVPVDAFQEVGDGTVDIVSILGVAHECGVAICHVEQDQSPDPIQSIGQSYQYLKQLG